MCLNASHLHNYNEIDKIFTLHRNRIGYVRMKLPDDSLCSKITNVASETISSIGKAISNTSITKVLKSITKIGTLTATAAVVTSVPTTITKAAINAVSTLNTNTIKKTFLEGLSKNFFIDNAKNSFWGLLIFGLLFPILRGLIHNNELHAPPIPQDYKTALKQGCNIGVITAISTGCRDTIKSLIARFFPSGITRWIFWGLEGYAILQLILYFILQD